MVWITPGIPITDVLLIPQSPVVNAILKMIHHPCHVSIEGGNLQTLKNDISRKGWGHTASSYALSKSHGSCHPDLSYGSVDTDCLLGGARKDWKRFLFYGAGSGWEKM